MGRFRASWFQHRWRCCRLSLVQWCLLCPDRIRRCRWHRLERCDHRFPTGRLNWSPHQERWRQVECYDHRFLAGRLSWLRPPLPFARLSWSRPPLLFARLSWSSRRFRRRRRSPLSHLRLICLRLPIPRCYSKLLVCLMSKQRPQSREQLPLYARSCLMSCVPLSLENGRQLSWINSESSVFPGQREVDPPGQKRPL